MLAELRNLLELGGDRDLQVVARDALVEGHRLELEGAPRRRVGDVDEERAAAAAVAGRREVERLRAGHRRLHGARRLREHLEPLRHRRPGALHRDLGGLDQLLAVLEVQLGVGPHRLEDLAEVVGADHLGPEAAVLVGQLGDLGKPDVVDLLGGLRGRRVEPQRRGVRLLAVGQPAEAALLVAAALGQHLVAEDVAVRRHAGVHVGLDHRAQAGLPAVDVHAVGRRSRRQQRVVGHRRGEDGVQLRDGVPHGEGCGEPPVGHALALPLGQLAVVATQPAELVDQRVRDVRVGEREHAHQDRHGDLLTEDRVRGELLQARLGDVGPGSRVGGDHGTRDPLLLVETGLVEPLGPLRERPQGRDLAVLGLPRHLLELPGPAVVTQQVGARGVGLQVVGPVLVGQDVDLRAHHRSFVSPSLGSRPSFWVVSSRICTLRILPVTVIGNSSTSKT